MIDPRREAETLFQEAADLPVAARQAFIAARSDLAVEVRDEVTRLLRHHEGAGVSSLREVDVLDDELPTLEGTCIGPYKVLQLLGEGGFGAVYMADQQRPIRRRVALKVIKAGMDTRHVIARFEAERQALARMDHSNIARVLDAGATAAGRPYFVMELVKGIPVTEYCDANRCTTEERLRLLLQVCRAVQHAHQKGIIHRDIKPSNILVTILDGEPVPKVIDFGIARATEEPITEGTLFTRFGEFIGTPQYMSPEQAVISGRDVDTRSDIYSLGVVLYELLTGTTPFDPKTLSDAGVSEMQRVIREVTPETPSRRLSSLGRRLGNVEMVRQTQARHLDRKLRGELDWIAMKALEKDRNRRYETAESLAADLKRYLQSEPVLAGPPSQWYRFRKLVTRHRMASTFLATLFVLMAWFGIWMGVLYARADRLRLQAERGRVAAVEAEERARSESETTSRVTDLLVQLFEISDPVLGDGESATARDLLDRGAARIGRELEGQPEVRSALLTAIARVYMNLGLCDRARPLVDDVLTHQTADLGLDHPETIRTKIFLGRLLMLDNRRADAEPILREAMAASRRVLGDDHVATLKAVKHLAWVIQTQGRLGEAEPLCREALAISRRTLGSGDPDTLGSMQTLAWLLQARGDFADAERLCREALAETARTSGEDSLRSAGSMNFLAVLLTRQKKLGEALELLGRAVEIHRTQLGDDHTKTLASMSNLAEACLGDQRLAEAEALYRRIHAGFGAVHGETDVRTLLALVGLGRVHLERNESAEAERHFGAALAVFRDELGEENALTYNLMPVLADLALDGGRPDEAEALAREFLVLADRLSGVPSFEIACAKSVLGACLTDRKSHEQAETFLLESLRALETGSADAGAERLKVLERLVRAYDSWGRSQTADVWRSRLENAREG